ncbi:arginine biosynthesis bifunctional protein [Phlyctema vagabunda]|uniref:Arginine biosynthesis bifunctional protein n=1 Tax=Phlyctema vagabunda TaxID=108571 RepID=A0ABR4PDB0_9HELO
MSCVSTFSRRIFSKKPFGFYQYRSFTKFDSFGNSPVPASKQRLVPANGVYPKGFLVGSTHVGIKPSSQSQPDLVLITSQAEWDTSGAAVLTKNEFPAASVVVTRDLVKQSGGKGLKGVIANSWCANLLTGPEGLEDSKLMSREAGRLVNGGRYGDGEAMMVMHTGKSIF